MADVTELVVSAVDVLGMSPEFVMRQGAAKEVLGQAEKYCKQWQLGMAGRGRGGQWPPKLLGATTPVSVADACALGQRRCKALDELVAAADADKVKRIAAVEQAQRLTNHRGNPTTPFTSFGQQLPRNLWVGKLEVLRAMEKNAGGDAFVLQLREGSVSWEAHALVGGTKSNLHAKPLEQCGEGVVWPNPRSSVVIISNGRDHYNGVCHRGHAKPEDEFPMFVGKNAQLDEWLNCWGVDLWPSTGNGFCGYESLSVSAALAGRKLCE